MFSPLAIADYYFSKSLIFAAITLPEDEYNLYRQLYNIIHQHLTVARSLCVPVSACRSTSRKTSKNGVVIMRRGINSEYLTKLQDGYFVYMKSRKDMKSLVIDTRNIDFVNNHADYHKIKRHYFQPFV